MNYSRGSGANMYFVVPGLPYYDQVSTKASENLATYVYLLAEVLVSVVQFRARKA